MHLNCCRDFDYSQRGEIVIFCTSDYKYKASLSQMTNDAYLLHNIKIQMFLTLTRSRLE